MKKIFFILPAIILSIFVSAQGNSGGKGKGKDKGNTSQTDNPANSNGKGQGKGDKNIYDEHDRKVWDGIGGTSCSKPSKNQPAKVRSSFQRDYPYTANVRWTKCRGDWTASFGNGLFRSTAVYHANGQRRDTRTPITRDNIPRRVLDEIFKRRPDTRLDDVIKIELPNLMKEIFRIKNVLEGKTEFLYLNADGLQVNYDY